MHLGGGGQGGGDGVLALVLFEVGSIDGQMDTPSYADARTHLKSFWGGKKKEKETTGNKKGWAEN